jgi:hypothetical protein
MGCKAALTLHLEAAVTHWLNTKTKPYPFMGEQQPKIKYKQFMVFFVLLNN